MKKNYKLILLFLLFILFRNNLISSEIYSEDSSSVLSLESLLNETVATASKFSQNISEAPSSVSIINSDEIKRYGWRTLNDALKSIKSFYFSNDRSYNYMGVRGFQVPSSYNNKILVLIDGKPFNEKIYGGSFFGNEIGFDLDFVEKIEIVNGPGSVLYGTGAFFGVINMITKSVNRINGTKLFTSIGSFGEHIANFYSGYNLSKDFNVKIGGKIGSISGQDLYFKEFDTDSTNHGISSGLDKETMLGLYSKIDYKDFSLNAYYFSREKDIPTAYWETIFNAPDNKFSDKLLKVDLQYDYKLDESKKLSFNVYYDEYRFFSMYPYLNDDKNILFEEENLGKWVGGEARLNWDLMENNNFVAGIEYNNIFQSDYKYGEKSNPISKFSEPYYVASLYVLDNFQLIDNFEVSAGLRYDNYSVLGSAFSPRIALIYSLQESTTFKLIYGSAYRIPSFYERLYNDPGRFKSNPNVKSEDIKSFDLVFEQKLNQSNIFTLDLYYNLINNLIDTRIDLKDSLPYYDNITDLIAYGIEFEYKLRLNNSINMTLSYAFTETKDVNDNILTNYPEHLFKLNLNYQITPWLYTGLNSYHESKRLISREGNSEEYTEPFLLLDLNFGLNFDFDENLSLIKQVFVSFKIENVLDKKIYLPVGVEYIQKTIEQNGISWRCNFGFSI